MISHSPLLPLNTWETLLDGCTSDNYRLGFYPSESVQENINALIPYKVCGNDSLCPGFYELGSAVRVRFLVKIRGHI